MLIFQLVISPSLSPPLSLPLSPSSLLPLSSPSLLPSSPPFLSLPPSLPLLPSSPPFFSLPLLPGTHVLVRMVRMRSSVTHSSSRTRGRGTISDRRCHQLSLSSRVMWTHSTLTSSTMRRRSLRPLRRQE